MPIISKKSDENLFRESTMTFGEHLEELRACLFKSLIALVAGFAVGLFLGGWVVEQIQVPLKKALTAYHTERAKESVESNLDDFLDRGYAEDVEQEVEKGFVPEEVYVYPAEVLTQLGATPPDDLPADDSEAESGKEDLVKIYIWRAIKDDERVQTKSLSAHEPFTIFIKAALLVGVLLASPVIFYQIWTFVAAGLYHHERKFVYIYGPFSLLLFFAGASLAFFCVFEPVLRFLFTFNDWLKIAPDPRISEWLGFVLMLPLGFGIAFQLPLVMLFLERIGIFTVEIYLSKWRIAILVIFVLSMFLTPADPTSMLLMAIPLTVLYSLGILLCRYLPRSGSPFDAAEE